MKVEGFGRGVEGEKRFHRRGGHLCGGAGTAENVDRGPDPLCVSGNGLPHQVCQCGGGCGLRIVAALVRRMCISRVHAADSARHGEAMHVVLSCL
jgi:hypothetical protein